MNPTPGPPENVPGPPSGGPDPLPADPAVAPHYLPPGPAPQGQPWSTPPVSWPASPPASSPPTAPPAASPGGGWSPGGSDGYPVSPSMPPYHPTAVPSPALPPAPVGPPVPPSGPGVQPPFAAPPTEGRTRRLWLGLGAAGLFVLLCCGGGVAAIAGLTVFGVRAIDERARVVVTDYVSALEQAEYGEAYALLCDDRQRAQSPADFAATESLEPRIRSFQVRPTQTGATDIVVPVDVTYASGSSSTLRFVLAQDRGTGEFEVCGVTD
ncbi:hypothetical protein O7635_37485 [Asanoa sp. WMMD1127]|uniref:hypothetical protein n=1 Tax=Asanoa sp. WMMD1127 TaxID=3016107 RepID=UPI002415BA14|nr:hypothetical protein [Asanoa sp. WMMD1127]MDG4827569.1 hypothetical protein [Asanoa sp. WMMD1127]